MSFAFPAQLAWLFLLPACWALSFWAARKKSQALSRWSDAAPLEKIFPLKLWKAENRRQMTLRLAGLALAILALAGPEAGQKFREVRTKGSNLFILFDCSDSMLAEDFKPNRMAKSQRLLSGLLERMHGNRVGVIAFAGEAYVYCPLTFDLNAVRQFLRSLQPGMIPQPGTKIGAAIRLALSKLPADGKSSAVVLLTDGEDHKSDPQGAAASAEKAGVPVFAIGVGSPNGEPIPLRDASGQISGYRKNKKGDVVMSRMDEPALMQIAQKTGGAYFRASDSEEEIDALAGRLEQLASNPLSARRRMLENRYQWLLLPGFILLVLSESFGLFARRSARAAALLIFSMLPAGFARAESFGREMRQGNRLYDQGKPAEALQHYEKAAKDRPQEPRADFNRGVAQYRLRQWDPAKEAFDQAAGAKDRALAAGALYNLGNAQFQKGQYDAAIEAYRGSLRLNPNDADARFNLRLALHLKNQPPQKNQKNQDPKKQQGGQGQDSEKKQAEEKERQENARRILKGAADPEQKPIFTPRKKGEKKNKDDEEDW